jgi:thymidine kinase
VLELITGPMFSGKTRELIRRLAAAELSGAEVAAGKPAFDVDPGWLVSLSGSRRRAVVLERVADLVDLAGSAAVVGVDEVQFLVMEFAEALAEAAARGVRVIVAGLDRDFRGEPFPTVAALAARAGSLTRLTASCSRCGAAATRSQRLLDGRPAPRDAPVVQLGGAELYEARCAACHVVPASGAEASAPAPLARI